MCTALTLTTANKKHLFGRTMDIEYSFNQSLHLVPRNFEYINKSTMETVTTKFAILGMATTMENHPLLADGFNEKGLGCAGLNFPGYAHLESEVKEGMYNLPSYDFMLYILGNFETVAQAREIILNLNLMDTRINPYVPASSLHWIITDKTGESIVVEKTKDSFKIFDNNVGVLANSPTFDWHTTNIRNYISLEYNQAAKKTWSNYDLMPLGQGAGLLGLPGDFSSPSRFIRAAYLRHAMMQNDSELVSLNSFFQILGNVGMVRGAVITPESKSDLAQYTACMSLEDGIYYYNTCTSMHINAVNMHNENLDAKEVKTFEYQDKLIVNKQN